MEEDFLLQVMKPARYIGREWNIPAKDFKNSAIRFLIAFPDLYEVGMSNLGLKILYGLLNKVPDLACERVFACELDMESLLRKQARGLFSLESASVLSEFNIIGFSLGSELDYTNVLNMLELGGIPLQASLRGHNDPLVIAGGPCVLNPEPMHEFFDLFVIGEGEEVILELVGVYRQHKEEFKSGRMSREDLLRCFSRIEGIYVPSLYDVKYGEGLEVEEFRPKDKDVPQTVRKRFVSNLDSCYFPADIPVPYIQIIHDRIAVEVMRGCPNRCRFCQARSQYYPLRLRNQKEILDIAARSYQCTGYDEISLAGLSVSDYPGLSALLKELTIMFKERAVSISLPSLKAKTVIAAVSSLIASIKKTGLTFAPESGSRKLRDILAKDFSEEDLFKALDSAFLCGYQHVKLYFMIGLPGENQQDLDGIMDLSERVSQARRKAGKPPAQVNISVNTLIPKPHTPLQWFPMESMDNVRIKQDYLKSQARKSRRIKISFHNLEMSFLEGILSRGDRRLSRVIQSAFKKGARFDAWSAHFSFEKWQEAFQECGIEPQMYLRARGQEDKLPWDFLDVGVNKEELREEFKKAIAT
jgi:radical SAM family uncharacterized protein